jgi:pyruvate-ferredoxin/flavodoxin oxidoreductase
VIDAIAHDGPALLRLHAPSPERHGFPKDMGMHRAKDAVRSRAFPLFRFDPSRGMNQVDLDGNPEPMASFSRDEDQGPFTPAHWALEEARFAHAFHPVPEDAETIELVDYLDLDEDDRSGKTPVVKRGDGTTLAVTGEMVAATHGALATWNTLQKLASANETGVPDLVEASLLDALKQQHAAELAAVQGQYDARLKDLSLEVRIDMARKVRGRLLTLLQRRVGNGDDTSVQPGEPVQAAEEEP